MFKGDDMAKKKAHKKEEKEPKKVSRRQFTKYLVSGGAAALALTSPFGIALKKGKPLFVSKEAHAAGVDIYKEGKFEKASKQDVIDMLKEGEKYFIELSKEQLEKIEKKGWVNAVYCKFGPFKCKLVGRPGGIAVENITPIDGKLRKDARSSGVGSGKGPYYGEKGKGTGIYLIPTKETDAIRGPVVAFVSPDSMDIYFFDKKKGEYDRITVNWGLHKEKNWNFDKGIKFGVYVDKEEVSFLVSPAGKLKKIDGTYKVSGGAECLAVHFMLSTTDIYSGGYAIE